MSYRKAARPVLHAAGASAERVNFKPSHLHYVLMRKYFTLLAVAAAFTAFAYGYVSSTHLETLECSEYEVGELDVNFTANESGLDLNGKYCAETSGFEAVETIDREGNVEVTVEIVPPEEAALQVITPVEFSIEEDLDDPGRVSYSVEREGEVLDSGEEVLEEGLLTRLSNWISSVLD